VKVLRAEETELRLELNLISVPDCSAGLVDDTLQNYLETAVDHFSSIFHL
jgi:hypothetical protein